MFLDKFKLEVIEIDEKPVDRNYQVIYHSSGKLQVFQRGKEEDVSRSSVVRLVASLLDYYKITVDDVIKESHGKTSF